MTNPVEQSRSVLTESLQILGHYKPGFVIVGGWVPEIHFPGKGHQGSVDVDYAVNPSLIPQYVYDTIKARLSKAGYTQTESGTTFLRDLGGVNPVKLDLITGQTGAGPASPVQGMMLAPLKGVELAFESNVQIEISGHLPDGTENTITASVATVEALILMKAIALDERLKEKDAYDIYFCFRHAAGGPQQLAQAVARLRDKPVVREALAVLAQKFKNARQIGPQWAAKIAAESGEDPDMVATDAKERVMIFLQNLRVF